MDKIKNLSLRKTIVLYMLVSLIVSFYLSALIMRIADTIQDDIWWKYVDQEKYFKMAEGDGRKYLTDVPRPNSYKMTTFDHLASEICDFLQTFTVLIVSVIGNLIAVFLFYKHKLKHPIEELELASQQVGRNNLDFHITYENKDEMGKLCREFERMREQLAENNHKLWEMIEEEKALRAAIAHDIRSPLSVLAGYQEMLSEYLPEEEIDIVQALDMVNESKKQIKRMVKRESWQLSRTSIPLGIVVGCLIGYVLVPKGWNWLNTLAIIVVISILTELSVVLSIRKPIKIAEIGRAHV